VVHFFFVYISKIGLPLRQVPKAVRHLADTTNKQTNNNNHWELTELKRPIFAA